VADKVKNQLITRSLDRAGLVKLDLDRKVNAPVPEIKKKTRLAAEKLADYFGQSPTLLVQIGTEKINEALSQIVQQPTDYVLEQILDLVKECRQL
jgi:hypothetical protein